MYQNLTEGIEKYKRPKNFRNKLVLLSISPWKAKMQALYSRNLRCDHDGVHCNFLNLRDL